MGDTFSNLPQVGGAVNEKFVYLREFFYIKKGSCGIYGRICVYVVVTAPFSPLPSIRCRPSPSKICQTPWVSFRGGTLPAGRVYGMWLPAYGPPPRDNTCPCRGSLSASTAKTGRPPEMGSRHPRSCPPVPPWAARTACLPISWGKSSAAFCSISSSAWLWGGRCLGFCG